MVQAQPGNVEQPANGDVTAHEEEDVANSQHDGGYERNAEIDPRHVTIERLGSPGSTR